MDALGRDEAGRLPQVALRQRGRRGRAMIRALALRVAPRRPRRWPQDEPQVTRRARPGRTRHRRHAGRVAITVLVPTYMPQPPAWPDLQIADAITRLPERATRPVTRRIGTASWSGLTRSCEIIPQRAADYDLGDAAVALTWAGPGTTRRQQATLPVPASPSRPRSRRVLRASTRSSPPSAHAHRRGRGLPDARSPATPSP